MCTTTAIYAMLETELTVLPVLAELRELNHTPSPLFKSSYNKVFLTCIFKIPRNVLLFDVMTTIITSCTVVGLKKLRTNISKS